MRQVVVLGVLLAAWPRVTAAEQPQSVLRCYGVETEIGIVARRDYFDDRGFVVKEVLYRSNDRTGGRTCAEDTLRVYSVKTITRDGFGRSVVETELSPNGDVERVLRHEYQGDSKEPSRDILSAPDGTRRYEIRRQANGRSTNLYYDSRGLVVGVIGPLPTDVQYAVRWGTEVDGWSCGIAVANGSLYVHLKNGTQKETTATFVDGFETALRDARGAVVPLLTAYAAKRPAMQKSRGFGRLVGAREAAFYTYPLEPRYGKLPAGHYTLAVWHPHPITGVMLLSNTYEFDVQ
jgi:hypothetical protein